ncbi:ABC transporter substrate-binding protein [Streptosporangium sp. DT93]|uniref:ABC transporter substrate-binding protein n=1 Tax=Streptosporangium sp. DT93 TaxID=3393428 RepID=UPI003CEAE76E
MLLTASTGCAREAAPVPDGGLEKASIKVGALAVPDSAPLYLAKARGYFADEGLTVAIEPTQSAAQAFPALEGGTLDVALVNYVSTFQAVTRGATFRVVADAYQAAPKTFVVMTLDDSKVKSMADLKGKTIGVASRRSIGSLTIAAALATHGLSESDVELLEFPLPDMVDKLRRGIIDAAWLTEPFITQATTTLGARLVQDMTASDSPTADFPVAGWGITAAYAAENPRTVAAFQRAITRAQRLAAGDRKAVTDILPTYTRIPPAVAGVIALGTYPVTLEAGRLQRVADLMHSYEGYLDEGATVDVNAILVPLPAGATSAERQ